MCVCVCVCVNRSIYVNMALLFVWAGSWCFCSVFSLCGCGACVRRLHAFLCANKKANNTNTACEPPNALELPRKAG